MSKDDNPFKGALAEKLANLDIEVSEQSAEPREEPQKPAKKPEKRPTPAKQAKPKPAKKSDEELFAEAVQNIDRSDVFRGKFGVPGDDWEPGQDVIEEAAAEVEAAVAEEEFDEEVVRDQVKELQNKRLLEHFVGQMDERFESGKYRMKQRRSTPEDDAGEDFVTPLLPKDGDGLREVSLETSQRKLLKSHAKYARKNRVPEVNLRGDTREQAIERLDVFVPNCHRRGDPFVRIICGRGKNSKGDPIIKPAVLDWIESAGKTMVKGFAPEVQSSGDYGSIIIEFDQPK